MIGGGTPPPYGQAVQRSRRGLHVVAVGPSDLYGQRRTALIGQGMALGPEFAPIRRIGACLRPPNGALTMTLSSDCHSQPIPRARSYSARSLAQNRSKTPAWRQAWKRRWQVEPDPYSRGSAFHWQPVKHVQDAIHHMAEGNHRPAGGVARFLGREQGFELGPQIVGDVPDDRETSFRLVLCFHERLPLRVMDILP